MAAATQPAVCDCGDQDALPSTLHGFCVTTVEGPNNSVLTNNVHDHYPVWSPDGTRIAFMHWQHDHWEIYVMNADGSNQMKILENVTDQLDMQYNGSYERVISWGPV